MEKKIMIEKNLKKNRIEVWEYNRKGFYNFKEYLPLDNTSLLVIKKQFKKYTIIDQNNLLEDINTKQLKTDTGIIMQL